MASTARANASVQHKIVTNEWVGLVTRANLTGAYQTSNYYTGKTGAVPWATNGSYVTLSGMLPGGNITSASAFCDR
ncbi:hypothetical protein C7474_1478 [Microbacterium telephonicum]|uniref:Uncharacterized protein n=1 Tax=Microbacterium telephonicum TaxID=1714841 RepID=A0A498C142_9MICO|nr:hypothetical protein C7474_1478 [Microbacterium telephonicum]